MITKISTRLFIPTKQISFKLSLRSISNSLSIYLSLNPRFSLSVVFFLNKSKESKNQVIKVQVKNIFKTILFCNQKTIQKQTGSARTFPQQQMPY